ncbi:MAG: histidine phosphatase family protein [Acidimicrobiales bacterium]|jgi:broad specificity phosphatase PhoE
MARVFLVRHGETALNAARVLRGQLDVPLNSAGEAQAAALGEAFREVPLRVVVSSPLNRAADTAREVAVASGARLEFDDRLRDRCYGEWAGHPLEEVEAVFGSINDAPGVEERQLFEARVEQAFHDAVDGSSADARGAVVLVAHDVVITTLIGLLVPGLVPRELKLPTGSWSELEREPGGGWTAVRLGELPTGVSRP